MDQNNNVLMQFKNLTGILETSPDFNIPLVDLANVFNIVMDNFKNKYFERIIREYDKVNNAQTYVYMKMLYVQHREDPTVKMTKEEVKILLDNNHITIEDVASFDVTLKDIMDLANTTTQPMQNSFSENLDYTINHKEIDNLVVGGPSPFLNVLQEE